MKFRFTIDSELLPAQLFAVRYFDLLVLGMEIVDFKFIEFEVVVPDAVTGYKLGQIMACAVRDFEALATKYRGTLSTIDSIEPDGLE